MAQGQLRSFLSLIALVCLIGGTFATALGMMKISEDPTGKFISDEEYIVPALVGNTLCVIFLVWLTATIPSRSSAYKIIVIIFLILGIVGEIYMTFFFTQPPTVYATYFVVVLNFLVRTFYVLEFVQDTWNPISWNDYVGYVAPKAESKPSGEPKKDENKPKVELDEKQKETKKKATEKLDASLKIFKGDPNRDGTTISKALQELKKQVEAGKSADDAYKAAKALLKYKDGSAYTGAGRAK